MLGRHNGSDVKAGIVIVKRQECLTDLSAIQELSIILMMTALLLLFVWYSNGY